MSNMGLFDFLKKKDLVQDPEPKEAAVEVTAQSEKPSSVTKRYSVTGTAHYKDAFKKLQVKNPDFDLSKKELINAGLVDVSVNQFEFFPSKVELVPEPTNEFDPNAIKVVVDGEHIGYIKKGNCSHLLKVISENRIESIDIKMHGGKYKLITQFEEGNSSSSYDMDTDSSEYGAKIEVVERTK